MFSESSGNCQLFISENLEDGAGNSQQAGREHVAISCFGGLVLPGRGGRKFTKLEFLNNLWGLRTE
jgi:hypothetical protein